MPISWCKYSNTVLKNKIFLSKNDIIPFSSGNRFRGAIEERTKEHTRERTGPRQVGPRQIGRESEKKRPECENASGYAGIRPEERRFRVRESSPGRQGFHPDAGESSAAGQFSGSGAAYPTQMILSLSSRSEWGAGTFSG